MSENESAPDKLRLKVVEGSGSGMLIEVEEELVIGRQAEGDGSLGSDIEISRRHARVSALSDGQYGIEDLGSTNGTFVNGRRIDSLVTLEPGDRIAVGASTLVVQVGRLQPTPKGSQTMVPTAAEGEPSTEADPSAAASTPSFALRIEVDVEAREAKVALDGSSEQVRLVYADGRWKIA